MRWDRGKRRLVGSIETLEPRVVLDGGPIITEFMANNNTKLTDQDGDHSDWIEIHNSGDVAVNLDDWLLTDNSGNLDKWVFPAVSLAPGGYLVVFASGKDRRVAGGELHTNFQLNTSGGYLALVEPDEETIATEFNPYPEQFADVSFGVTTNIETTTLLANNSAARVLVPDPAGSLPANWTDPLFDDSGWVGGATTSNQGVGYETGAAESTEPSALLSSYSPNGFWRFSETAGTTSANAGTNGAALNGTYTGAPNVNQAGPQPPAVIGFEPNNSATQFNGTSQFMTAGGNGTLSNLARFTMMGWIRRTANQNTRTGLWGQNDAVEFGFIDNGTIQIWTPGGGSLNTTWPHGNDGQWHHVATVGDGTNLRTYIDGVQVGGPGGTATGGYGASAFPFRVGGGGIFDDGVANGNYYNGDIDEVALWTNVALSATQIADYYNAARGGAGSQVDFTPHIQTNVNTQMLNVNSTALVRLPFTIDGPPDFDSLNLSLNFDDGYLAYLNGVPVSQANAPAVPAANSTATQRRADGLAVVAQSIDLTNNLGALAEGENVLAIQGLNLAADNPDFLIRAALSASRATSIGAEPRYFVVSTAGQPNGLGAAVLGPIISDATHSPNVPTTAQPIVVTAKITQAGDPVASATLHYRAMFGATVSLGMVDDGSVGGDLAGDGVYTAVIPAGVATAGQMVRWFITASDTTAHNSRWPLFYDPVNSEEYLGTMIADPSVSSALPVFHWFVQNPSGADSDTGARSSLFYDGEFYDNVMFDLHGQSSRGFPKKSYDIDFTDDHRFRLNDDVPLMKDINFLTNYSDKTKLRNTLAYDVFKKAGSAYHLAFPIRVQQNGVFWGVTDFVEDGDDVWTDRLGLDKEGALYKSYNRFGDATSGWEKKSRRDEGNADLAAFSAGFHNTNVAARNAFLMDNVDIPTTLNFLVGSAIASNYDCCHKNYYVYRDVPPSEGGTGEWAVLPWDVDLSWSHAWSPSGYHNDANVYNAPLYLGKVDMNISHPNGTGGASISLEVTKRNDLLERLYALPGFEAMYRRRLRTLMDTLLGAAPGQYEEMIDELVAQIGNDAALDNAKWASWGQNQAWATQINLLKTAYLPARRNFLFTHPDVPSAQPGDAMLTFGAIDFNPTSGNQDQEFIQITNPNVYAVDVSDWTLVGEVEHTFKPGTVIPAGGSIYVTPDSAAFRARTSGPGGNQGLFIQGGYDGHLSSFGGTLSILDTNGREAATTTYVGAPSQQQLDLRVTEIMYNPSEPTPTEIAAGYTNENFFEYVELQNTGSTTLDLTNVRFTSGIAFNFTGSSVTSLAPGQRVLVVRDPAGFAARYGAPAAPIAGMFTGGLDNAGEVLKLEDSNSSTIQQFDYEDDWYPQTDGGGFSLVVRSETQSRDLWDTKLGWRPSNQAGGTAGADDTFTVPAPGSIAFNEVLAHSNAPAGSRIELFNTTGSALDISGWYLSNDPLDITKYHLPSISPFSGLGLVLEEQTYGSSFELSAHGGQLILTAADGAGTQLGYQTAITYGASDLETTQGPYTNSVGDEDIVVLATPTLGATNSGPRVGPVVINEVHYNPATGFVEFIELRNPTASSISLNGWSFSAGVNYAFGDVSMAPGGYLLVVPVDPATFSAPPGVPVVGPYTGVLDNGGENLSLVRAGDVGQFVVVDRVRYDDTSPWPTSPDGTGPSLSRLSATSFTNDPNNWGPGSTTPGAANLSFDESPPTVPQNVVATIMPGPTGPMVSLSWSESSDPQSGIAFYSVYRDGLLLQTTTDTTFTQSGLATGTTYSYQVAATNASNITSARGGPAPVRLMTILSAAKVSDTQVRVSFSEGVTPATANNVANYFIGGLPITGAALEANGTQVLLTTGATVQQGQPYRLSASDIFGTNPGSVLVPGAQVIFTPGVSNGVLGEYYDSTVTNFDNTATVGVVEPAPDLPFGTKVGERTDPFPPTATGLTWLGAPPVLAPYTPFNPPLPTTAANTFGVRWTGRLLAPVTGPYTFSIGTNTGDGVRLWLDADNDTQFEDGAERLINAWPTAGTNQLGTPIDLVGGEFYRFRIEAYDDQSTFQMNFRWQHPNQATAAIVPASNIFTPTLIESDSPAATAIRVKGSDWTPAFLAAIETAGLGSGGVSVPLGGVSSLLPWTGVNQISVQFDEDVSASANSLVVSGVNVPNYSIASFEYDYRTYTGTWTLAEAIDQDRVTINFTSMNDLAGNDLSGMGTATVRGLGGDVDRDGDVDLADFQSNRSAQFSGIGSAAYSVYQDTDGNGAVNVLDWQNVYTRIGNSVPAPSAAPSAVLARAIGSPSVTVSAEATTAARPLRVGLGGLQRSGNARAVDAAVNSNLPRETTSFDSTTTLRARRMRLAAPRTGPAVDAGLLSFLEG
jgi:spore coat protein CotH